MFLLEDVVCRTSKRIEFSINILVQCILSKFRVPKESHATSNIISNIGSSLRFKSNSWRRSLNDILLHKEICSYWMVKMRFYRDQDKRKNNVKGLHLDCNDELLNFLIKISSRERVQKHVHASTRIVEVVYARLIFL